MNQIPFDNIYKDHIFVIYPFITKYEGYGSITVSEDKFNILTNKLSKTESNSIKSKVYIYRDLEYHTFDNQNDNQNDDFVIHKKIVHTCTDNNFLLTISKCEILDNNSFPKLNKYHDEYTKIIKTYKFGNITLDIVTANEKYNYIEITFRYNFNLNLNVIKKDLKYIDELLNK